MIDEKDIIEIKAMLNLILNKVPTDQTSSELYSVYLLRWFSNYKEPKNTEYTSKLMFGYITERIIPALGDIPLNRLSGDKIQEFLNSIQKTNTRNKIAMVISGSLTKAKKLRLITYNPFDAVELTAHRAKHYRALTMLEQSVVYSYLVNLLYLAIYNILICTGMRIGEFLALDSDCIDRENRLIKVYKTVNIHNGQLQDRTKTYTSVRLIPYLPELEQYIDKVLKKGRISYNQVKQYFKKVYLKNSLKGLNLHSFRHTFGCMCYHVGISDKLIQRLMGHAMLDVTMNVYVDVLGSGKSPFLDYFKKYKKDVENRPTDFWRFSPP